MVTTASLLVAAIADDKNGQQNEETSRDHHIATDDVS